jgi:hypothetical protein
MDQEHSRLSTGYVGITTTSEFVQWTDIQWRDIEGRTDIYWQQASNPKSLCDHLCIYRAMRPDCATNQRAPGGVQIGDICILRKDSTETLYDGHVLGAMAWLHLQRIPK